MKEYLRSKSGKLKRLGLALGLCALLSGCVDKYPEIERVGDVTGDEIPDVMLRTSAADTWLFIGGRDGKFTRTYKHNNPGVPFNFYRESQNSTNVYFLEKDGEESWRFITLRAEK